MAAQRRQQPGDAGVGGWVGTPVTSSITDRGMASPSTMQRSNESSTGPGAWP